jgi:uncharacterized repeat protein (TIGR01451 family)
MPQLAPGLTVDVATVANPIRQNTQSRAFQVTVSNNQTVPVQNVRVTLLIPPGLRFIALDDSQSQLPVAGQSPDGTQIYLQSRAEMRAREALTFWVTVVGDQAGQPVMAAIVESASAATARDSDAVNVQP